MALEPTLRAMEMLLAFAFLQQSVEYLSVPATGRALFVLRMALSLMLLFGLYTFLVLPALLVIALLILKRFAGPYNGGSDRMGFLVLFCLTLARLLPDPFAQEMAMGYLALQLSLSYFISGWVKVVNPEWRRGRALCDVFRFSAYPVSESLRSWADWPGLLFFMSWAVMLFELLFPLALFSFPALVVAFFVAALFHLANACLFGLNRFFWIWLSAWPAIFWLQHRFFI